jgi:hypothetical protein
MDFIERGDYDVISAEDNQIIRRSDLIAMEPGMKLEMSIVMRQKTANQQKCPRCDHINLQVASRNGWIEWQVSQISLQAGNW